MKGSTGVDDILAQINASSNNEVQVEDTIDDVLSSIMGITIVIELQQYLEVKMVKLLN